MKNSLLILVGAAALSLASCSQEKTTEVNTAPGAAADGTATTTTTTTTTTGPESEAAIEARAQRIADKMVASMKITDEATKTKIRTVYVNRAKRMSEMKTKYATDTTGMAAATRAATAATDQEFKVIFVEPTQYQAYESSRSTYDDSNYMEADAVPSDNGSTPSDAVPSGNNAGNDNMANTNMSNDNSNMSGTSTDAMTASKMKAKAMDGSKLKVKENGKVKTKDADGTKMKN